MYDVQELTCVFYLLFVRVSYRTPQRRNIIKVN